MAKLTDDLLEAVTSHSQLTLVDPYSHPVLRPTLPLSPCQLPMIDFLLIEIVPTSALRAPPLSLCPFSIIAIWIDIRSHRMSDDSLQPGTLICPLPSRWRWNILNRRFYSLIENNFENFQKVMEVHLAFRCSETYVQLIFLSNFFFSRIVNFF